jgi:adenylate cyclase
MHGRLVEELRSAGAAVIAFDVVFAEPSDAAEDQYLAGAIQDAGNVVLASDVASQEAEQFSQVMRVEPLHLFSQAGAASGLAAVELDGDLAVRRLPDDDRTFWRQVLRRHPDPALRTQGDARLPAGALMRYAGPDHTFRFVSYYQALEASRFLPPGSLKGRIVLVGRDVKTSPEAGATGTDAFATPFATFTGRLMPGVEVHANAIETVLSGRVLREASRGPALLVLALAIGAAALGLRRWRPVQGAAVCLLLAAIVAFGTWWSFSRWNVWLPAVAPMTGLGLMYVAQGGAAFLREQERRREVKRAFSHYVSPDVVNEILAHPETLRLGGERRDLTIMFTDLAGFTTAAERLEPEQVAELLNEHFTEMTAVVLGHGGTVDKFIGDAVMAFWNAPLFDPDHVLHGCEAALAMQEAIDAPPRQARRARPARDPHAHRHPHGSRGGGKHGVGRPVRILRDRRQREPRVQARGREQALRHGDSHYGRGRRGAGRPAAGPCGRPREGEGQGAARGHLHVTGG